MANKISVLIDVATDKAVSGLKGFKQSIADADGAVGKMKAGAASAFDSIKANAGNMALAAGAALVTFGVKSVQAFQNVALEAGKFSDISGLAVEDASRWLEVGDHIGINAGVMERAFGKLNAAIAKGGDTLKEYGIEVVKASDGTVDANATFLKTIDTIKAIQDPTKKAQAAQAAFGKGWQEMSELIQLGSAEIVVQMGKVSDAKLVDEEELAKARKMRASLDDLKDSVEDIALTIGEDLVPTLTMLMGGLTAIIEPLMAVNQWSKNVAISFYEMIGIIDKKEPVENAVTAFGKLGGSLDAATAAGDMHIEMQEGLRPAVEESTAATDAAKKSAVDYEGALEGLNDALDARIAATNALVGGDIAVRDSQREAAAAVRELTAAEAEGKLSAEELGAAQDGAAESLLDAAGAALKYDVDLAAAAGQTLTATQKQVLFKAKLEELAATLAPGSALRRQIQGYIDDLNAIPRDVTTTARVATSPIYRNARGTSNFPGGLSIVGEDGPELVAMPAGSQVFPAGETAAMLNGHGGSPVGGSVNVYVQTLDGSIGPAALAKLVDAINRGVRTGAVKIA